MEGVFFVASILFVIKAFLLIIHSIGVEPNEDVDIDTLFEIEIFIFFWRTTREIILCNYDILTDFTAWVV